MELFEEIGFGNELSFAAVVIVYSPVEKDDA